MAKIKKKQQGSKIPDKKRKQILATYLEIGTYTGAAKVHGISMQTVKRIANENPNLSEVLEQKKEENTRTVIEYMDSKAKEVQTFIDRYMKEFMNEEKIVKLPLNQLSTVFGTVIDKFTMKDRLKIEKEEENKRKLKELQEVFKVVNHGTEHKTS